MASRTCEAIVFVLSRHILNLKKWRQTAFRWFGRDIDGFRGEMVFGRGHVRLKKIIMKFEFEKMAYYDASVWQHRICVWNLFNCIWSL
jgi:hypothetical protein